jgi:hypothetical protein
MHWLSETAARSAVSHHYPGTMRGLSSPHCSGPAYAITTQRNRMTFVLSIAGLMLAYLPTNRNIFLIFILVIVVQLVGTLLAYKQISQLTGWTVFCDQTSSDGFGFFRVLHCSVTYFVVLASYYIQLREGISEEQIIADLACRGKAAE